MYRLIMTLMVTVLLSSCMNSPTTRGGSSNYATRDAEVVFGDEQTYPRIALVIGNNNYQKNKRLTNAVPDARAMRDFFTKRDFKVVYAEDADKETMKRKINEFMGGLGKKSVAVIYYAGHASQDKSRQTGITTNYLVPINDSSLTSITDYDRDAISMNYILNKADELNHGLNIAMLDACRTPIGRGGNIQNIGAEGVYLVYSTASGTTASDSGAFRRSFLKYANQPLKLTDIFGKVKLDLRSEGQRPSIQNDVVGNFYFSKPKLTLVVTPTSIPTPQVVERIVDRDRPIRSTKRKEATWNPHINGITHKKGACNITDNRCSKGLPFPSFNNYIDMIYREKSYDARYFLRVKNRSTKTSLKNNVLVKSGDYIYLQGYIDNNGYDNSPNVTAHNVHLKMSGFHHIGDGVYETKADTSIVLEENIFSEDAIPQSISDSVIITSKNGEKIKLQFIPSFKLKTSRGDKYNPSLYFSSKGENIGDIKGGEAFYSKKIFFVTGDSAPSYDLKINKTVDGQNSKIVNRGDILNYKIYFQNISSSHSIVTNITLYDNYDETKLKIDASTLPNNSNLKCIDNGDIIICNLLKALAPKGGVHFNYKATVKSTASGQIVNSVKIQSIKNHNISNNNIDSVIVTVRDK